MRLRWCAAILLVLAAAGASAETPAAPAPQPVVKLSRGEQKARIAKLGADYQQFLLDVEAIMQPAERDAFLLLESDPQRDLFVDDFWLRRDKAAGTTRAFRQLYYDRLATAKQRYGSISGDRSRVYLLHGDAAQLIDSDRCELLQPLQVWTYYNLRGFESPATFLFYQPRDGVNYVLWQPYVATDDARLDLISRQIIATEGKERALQRVFGFVDRGRTRNFLQRDCPSGDEIFDAIMAAQQRRLDNGKVFEPPPVNAEEVRKVLRSVVIPTAGAKALPAEASVSYPGRQRGKTVAELTILVPKAQLAAKEVGSTTLYSIDVTGEVLKDGQMFETYRYRFDYPAGIASEKVAVVVDRILLPAQYTSRIKVADINSGAEVIVETPLTVPDLAVTAGEQKQKEEAAAVVATIKDRVDANEPMLRIVPLPDQPLTGLQHIETVAYGQGLASVEFYLDGKKIMRKGQPPYALDLDLGGVPQLHHVRAVALNAAGDFIAGDEVDVNSGNDPFRLRILSPRVAPKLRGKTRVELSVQVPDKKKLEKVELFLGETRVATLYGPPFVQVVDVPAQEGIGYFRAVASLKDAPEQPPIEDVVMFNTPQYMGAVEVHLVELPTTVLREGRPINDLPESAFTVLDEGKPVKVAKFEQVTNLPLSLGLAIDTSASMQPRIGEAQKAASQFFTNTLRTRDRAFLIAFDSQPQLVLRWSSNLADVNSGLARLRADESTALFDAVVFALYNFVGVRGQKALVVITDGKDTASKFSFDQAIEYARRAGVPIYAIGIGIGPAEVDVRYKLGRFASETGGNVYFIERAEDLSRIYSDIQNELRSQYILGFYAPEGTKPGSKWHEVTVQTDQGKVKTIRGYYP
jgi:Ca-activated chloride channel family protein